MAEEHNPREYETIPASLHECFVWWAKEVLNAGGVWWTNSPTGQQRRQLTPEAMEQLKSLVFVLERGDTHD